MQPQLNFESMSGPELVEWYNKHAHKPVTKFASRAKGIDRCWKLLDAMRFDAPDEQQETATMNEETQINTPDPDRSAAMATSWQDPEVRAKRAARHAITVNGETYKSMYKAFEVLGLDLKDHAKVRMQCVQNGTVEYEGHTFKLAS